MHCNTKEIAYGCLFCRTGWEKVAAIELERHFPWIKTIVPVKSRYWRHGGIATEEQVILFPGYIFFRTSRVGEINNLAEHNAVLKLLKTPSGDWKLYGEDKRLVEKLFEYNGVIGFSKAYFVGNKIRIVDGYLKAFEGQIVKVNKRAQTAQIKIHIYGKEIFSWLGFEQIDRV